MAEGPFRPWGITLPSAGSGQGAGGRGQRSGGSGQRAAGSRQQAAVGARRSGAMEWGVESRASANGAFHDSLGFQPQETGQPIRSANGASHDSLGFQPQETWATLSGAPSARSMRAIGMGWDGTGWDGTVSSTREGRLDMPMLIVRKKIPPRITRRLVR